MKTTFDKLIRDVDAFDAKMARPLNFYRSVGASYHATARAIAKRVLMLSMPQGHDKDRWTIKVDRAAEAITAQLMTYGGIQLTMFERDEEGNLAPKSQRPSSQKVTHADVVEWVKEGEMKGSKSDPGKNWRPRDHNIMADARSKEAGYRAIATIVMRAYYSNRAPANYTRLRRAIQGYLYGGDQESGSKTLEAIAIAWAAHFKPRHHRDLKAWVSKQCRDF